MHQARRIAAASALMRIGCAKASTHGSSAPLAGIRFHIGTAELPTPAQGILGTFEGAVEFAA